MMKNEVLLSCQAPSHGIIAGLRAFVKTSESIKTLSTNKPTKQQTPREPVTRCKIKLFDARRASLRKSVSRNASEIFLTRGRCDNYPQRNYEIFNTIISQYNPLA